jgi:hypothetical protein
MIAAASTFLLHTIRQAIYISLGHVVCGKDVLDGGD